jgi:hypothetical protein
MAKSENVENVVVESVESATSENVENALTICNVDMSKLLNQYSLTGENKLTPQEKANKLFLDDLNKFATWGMVLSKETKITSSLVDTLQKLSNDEKVCYTFTLSNAIASIKLQGDSGNVKTVTAKKLLEYIQLVLDFRQSVKKVFYSEVVTEKIDRALPEVAF